MPIHQHPAWQQFVGSFNAIARHRHRYEVFRDFVTMAAIAMHNAVRKDDGLEKEYLQIVGRYPKEDVNGFCELLAKLVLLLDGEPRDVLGTLYMSLDLGNDRTGQFFTPPEISEMMARMAYGDRLAEMDRPFFTVGEPACGAGGMVLAIAKVLISHGHDPARRMWTECRDVDRLAALMCYLQLSLWNIPGVVIVGNTLKMEAREVFYTPQHHLGMWEWKLRRDHENHQARDDAKTVPTDAGREESVPYRPPTIQIGKAVQLDLGF